MFKYIFKKSALFIKLFIYDFIYPFYKPRFRKTKYDIYKC